MTEWSQSSSKVALPCSTFNIIATGLLPWVNDIAVRNTHARTHTQMKKTAVRDRATPDRVISSLGKGPQVFGKVLCK